MLINSKYISSLFFHLYLQSPEYCVQTGILCCNYAEGVNSLSKVKKNFSMSRWFFFYRKSFHWMFLNKSNSHPAFLSCMKPFHLQAEAGVGVGRANLLGGDPCLRAPHAVNLKRTIYSAEFQKPSCTSLLFSNVTYRTH